YIDVRDAAAACRLALEAPAESVAGSPAFIIAAADTVMNRPSAELLAEVFPGVPLRREVGESETLLAIDRARQGPGCEPQPSWRDHLPAHASAAGCDARRAGRSGSFAETLPPSHAPPGRSGSFEETLPLTHPPPGRSCSFDGYFSDGATTSPSLGAMRT